VTDAVRRALHLGMRVEKVTHRGNRQAGGVERLLELALPSLPGSVRIIWHRESAWTSASPLIWSGA